MKSYLAVLSFLCLTQLALGLNTLLTLWQNWTSTKGGQFTCGDFPFYSHKHSDCSHPSSSCHFTPLIILSFTHDISEDGLLSCLYHDLLAISLMTAYYSVAPILCFFLCIPFSTETVIHANIFTVTDGHRHVNINADILARSQPRPSDTMSLWHTQGRPYIPTIPRWPTGTQTQRPVAGPK